MQIFTEPHLKNFGSPQIYRRNLDLHPMTCKISALPYHNGDRLSGLSSTEVSSISQDLQRSSNKKRRKLSRIVFR